MDDVIGVRGDEDVEVNATSYWYSWKKLPPGFDNLGNAEYDDAMRVLITLGSFGSSGGCHERP